MSFNVGLMLTLIKHVLVDSSAFRIIGFHMFKSVWRKGVFGTCLNYGKGFVKRFGRSDEAIKRLGGYVGCTGILAISLIIDNYFEKMSLVEVDCYDKNCNSYLNNEYEILFRAVKNNDFNYVKNFLKNNSNIDERNQYGWTALLVAVASNNLEITKLLLEHGADPNICDEYPGVQRLASRRAFNDMRQLLYERVNNFNTELDPYINYTGFTPLHYACICGHAEIAYLLIQKGADTTLRNVNGELPADLCLIDEMKKTLTDSHEKQIQKLMRAKLTERPLEKVLKENLVGQRTAISTVSNAIRRKLSGWCLQDRPLVFLFLGSSGVGKTELAKLVAHHIYDNKNEGFIRLDMSEYQEKHQVARMIGSPPGYIGYDEGGQLTKLLKTQPNAVVLLDEIEKAHPDVLTILLQLFDEGRITDSKGETIQASGAIFIMTSNLASEVIREHAHKLQQMSKTSPKDENLHFSKEFKNDYIYPILKKNLKRDEFLGRINEFVYFLPFSERELTELVDIQLQRAKLQINKKHGISLTYDKDVLDVLADGFDVIYGARSLQNEVESKILNKLANYFVDGHFDNAKNVHISINYGKKESPLKSPEFVFTIKDSSSKLKLPFMS